MRVLFTVHMFKGFTGSELVTLDQAKFLLEKGNEVDVFTLEKDGVLSESIPPEIRVIDVPQVDDLHENYDIVISRQWPLLEYLLFTKKINAGRVYYESISWCLPVDFFPYFYEELTMCGYISKRIQNTLNSMGYDTSESYYFPNYARGEFFACRHELRCQNGNPIESPKRIAMVSNHPPVELEDAMHVLESERGVEVGMYGMHHDSVLVTPDLLDSYDAIVTVGKTAFFALAMGIPVYLYDEHCTTGYVTVENYQACLDNNMAGSDGYCKREPQQIAAEIIDGFTQASEQSDELRSFAERDFAFESLMNAFLEELYARPEMDMDALRAKYPYAEFLSPVYINEADFGRRDALRWYRETMYMTELVKESNEHAEAIVNSKGWKALEALRKPLRLLKRK